MAKSLYDYWFAPKAESDLDETLTYIEQKLHNPKAAYDFVVELFEKIDIYRKFPELGLKVDNEFILKDLRKFFVKNYIVYYYPNKETKTIIIVRVLYGGRNVDEILKTL